MQIIEVFDGGKSGLLSSLYPYISQRTKSKTTHTDGSWFLPMGLRTKQSLAHLLFTACNVGIFGFSLYFQSFSLVYICIFGTHVMRREHGIVSEG